MNQQIKLRTLSLGGGVQSSTIVEMMVDGALPMADLIIFADTGDEPEHVYKQIWYLATRLGSVNMPLIVVNNGDMVKDIYSNGRFAAMPLWTVNRRPVSAFGKTADILKVGRLKRQCTHEYKIVPIERFIRSQLLARGLAKKDKLGRTKITKGVMVEVLLGISLDEAERMKPSRIKWMVNKWPLIDKRMSRFDCINWLKANGHPVPQKSSCKRCPYHDNAHFLEMKTERPKDWAEVTRFDDNLRDGTLRLAVTAKGDVFLHETCIPLSEVNLSEGPTTKPLEICDEGFCGVWL